MKILTLVLLIGFSVGCAPKKAAAKSYFLNGTWIPIREEMGGTPLPAAAFKNQKLILTDDTYTFSAESVDKGNVSYKREIIDIYGKVGVNAGKHIKAIYKLENSQLTVCYNLGGDDYPTTFDTKGKPQYFVAVFKNN